MLLRKMLAGLAAVGLAAGCAGAMAAAGKAAERKPDSGKAQARKESPGKKAVVVTVKPPSGQWEGKPPPAEGWTWRAGYHDWNGERFVWKPGEWILEREGMDFRQYEWVEAGEGKWKLVGGDWVASKDSG